MNIFKNETRFIRRIWSNRLHPVIHSCQEPSISYCRGSQSSMKTVGFCDPPVKITRIKEKKIVCVFLLERVRNSKIVI